MYAGHAAIALAIQAREPRLPIIPLVIACFGPDWLEAALLFPRPREGMAPYTHSILAILVGATLFAGLYALIARRPGARWLLVGWLLHWPADFFTGLKPLTGLHDMVGLDLYHMPLADFLLEAAVIGACCAVYARRFAPTGRERRMVLGLALALLVLQAMLDLRLSRDRLPWRPSLAESGWQPHLVPATADEVAPVRMALAASPGTFTASEQWQRSTRGVW